MTLSELQEWLGHSTPTATQHYAKLTPLKVAKSYADAGYFARNLRAIEVLLDQDVVRSGLAATEPWKFYDLGHGYCTYEFFDQASIVWPVRSDFYMPKDSTAALLLEGRTHLLRLLQEIPLGEAEQAAVEDGVAAYENLLSKLSDVPTPAGPTPRQLGAGLVQITSVRPALPASTLTDSRSNGAGSRARLIHAIRVESELQLTVRESQSQGFGASLDVPESSMLPKTLFPGA
jgi:hypothetical protein